MQCNDGDRAPGKSGDGTSIASGSRPALQKRGCMEGRCSSTWLGEILMEPFPCPLPQAPPPTTPQFEAPKGFSARRNQLPWTRSV